MRSGSRALRELMVLMVLCATPLALGQAPQPEEHGFSEQLEISRVDVPILVVGANGEPITDITAAELTVSTRGRALRVASLSRASSPVAVPAARAELVLDDPSGLAPPAEAIPPPGRAFVLYIDLQTLDRERRVADRNAVMAFAREALVPGDRVAVAVNTGEPALELAFSSDRLALQAAIERAFARNVLPGVSERRRIEDLLSELGECVDTKSGMGERCFRGVAVEYTAQRLDDAQRSLQGLRAAIAFAAARTEPAVVLAITHGAAADTSAELAEAARALAGDGTTLSSLTLQADVGIDAVTERAALIASAVASRVVVHVIDPTVVTAGSFSARQNRFEAGARPFEVARRAPQLDTAQVAAASGGTFREQTDLQRGLKVATELERGRYLVSIDVGRQLLDRDQLRRLEWRVHRARARVIAGQGSYPSSAPSRTLAATLKLGQPQTDQDGRRSLRFVVLTDPRPLGYAQLEDRWQASLAVHVELFDAAGTRLADSYLFLSHDYTATVWAAHDEGALRLSGRMTVPLGGYRLLVSVRNVRDGSGGELAQSFKLAESG